MRTMKVGRRVYLFGIGSPRWQRETGHTVNERGVPIPTRWTPLRQYERGLITLDELAEMDPTIDPAFLAEQEELLAMRTREYAERAARSRAGLLG